MGDFLDDGDGQKLAEHVRDWQTKGYAAGAGNRGYEVKNGWVIKGAGIDLRWWHIVLLNMIIVLCYVLSYFISYVMEIAYDIFGWIIGILSIWLCSN